MKRCFLILSLLTICIQKSYTQCSVVINEVMPAATESDPNADPPQANNMVDDQGVQPNAEWVELYNTSSCESVDISCYSIGSNMGLDPSGAENWGSFTFPAGTVIPPNGYIVVGGNAAPSCDFKLGDLKDDPNFCHSDRWYLSDNEGWIGLYDNTGTPIDAVYWNMANNENAPNSGTDNSYTHDISTDCHCNSVNTLPKLADIPAAVRHFAGQPEPGSGKSFQRQFDGSDSWVYNESVNPNACNMGDCVQPPVLTITKQEIECFGELGALTVNIQDNGTGPDYTISWDDLNNQTTAQASNLGSGNYEVTVTDNCGCSTTASETLSEPDELILSVITEDATCGENNGSATVIASGGPDNNYNYLWNDQNNQTTATAQNLGLGTYTITVSSGVCSKTDTVIISNSNGLILDLGPDSTICPGSTVELDASEAGWSSYLWSDGSGSSALIVSGGVYWVEVTDELGCTISDTIEIIEAPLIIDIGEDTILCEGESYELLPTSSGAIDTYNWSDGSHNPLLMVSNTGIYWLEAISPGGCIAIDTVNISFIAYPDPTIEDAGPFCSSDGAETLIAASQGGMWYGTGITDSNLGVFDPSIAQIGLNEVYYEIGNGSCLERDTLIISVSNELNASMEEIPPLCANVDFVKVDPVDSGGVFSSSCGFCIDETTGEFYPQLAAEGIHTITYYIDGLCGDTSTIEIEVLPLADAFILPSGPYCVSGTADNLTAVNPGGTWSGPGITNSTLGIFSPNQAGVGLHWIFYEINGQCGDKDSLQLEVIDELDPTISEAGPFCEDEGQVFLQAEDSGGIWTATCINCIDSISGEFITSSATIGVNQIYYTILDFCPVRDSISIEINPIPQIDFYAEERSGCVPFETTFFGLGTNNSNDCIWSFGDGSVANSCDSIDKVFKDDGCYNISLTVSENGCSNTVVKNSYVCAHPVPIVDFYFSPEITDIHNPEFEFTDQTLFGGNSWWWDFAGLGSANTENAEFEFFEPGLYPVCLKVDNEFGCEDSICHNVMVRDDFIIWLPNTFTPDGDGINDTFFPKFGYELPIEYEFSIYDRWGEQLFYTDDVSEYWDGSYHSKIVQQDVYVWRIRLKKPNGEAYEDYYGNVNVIK